MGGRADSWLGVLWLGCRLRPPVEIRGIVTRKGALGEWRVQGPGEPCLSSRLSTNAYRRNSPMRPSSSFPLSSLPFIKELRQDRCKPWPHPRAHLSHPGHLSWPHLSVLTYPSLRSSQRPGRELGHLHLVPFVATAVPEHSISIRAAHGGKTLT